MLPIISWFFIIPTYAAFIFNLCFFVTFPVARTNDSKFIKFDDSINNPLFVNVNENSQVTFSCGRISGGQRPLDVTWMKDGYKISSQMNYTGDELIFTIFKADRKDAGLYRCLLKNKYDMRDFTYDSDTSSKVRTDKSYVILSPPRLDVESMEALMFTWFYEDQIIRPKIDRFISYDGKLVLMNIVGSDSGKYHVLVHHKRLNTSLRSRDINLEVEINHGTGDAPLRPNIILEPADIKHVRFAELNSNDSDKLILECVVACRNNRYLRINWYHNESLIPQSKSRKYKLEDFNRRLIVWNSSQQSDSGVYSCQATLEGFPSLTDKKEAWVEIYDIPQVRILTDSESNIVHIESRSRLELPCLLFGPAKSTIKWYFNGQDVESSPFLCCDDLSLFDVTNSNSLIIKRMTDKTAGTYQCEAIFVDHISPIATIYLKEEGAFNSF
uniref:Ig-like domain-containing protein n=1 Tax=Romanomermis culicivorax TaxID=13658 RepID=A0A915HKK4_ROMCU